MKQLISAFTFCFFCFLTLASQAQETIETKPRIKALGVFKVSYLAADPTKAAGGLAGTAFFVRPNEAFSAYHVMGPDLFKPNAGYDSVKVWLIHENLKPIEISLSHMRYDAGRDLSAVVFAQPVVSQQFIYHSDQRLPAKVKDKVKNDDQIDQLMSEGYALSEPSQVLLRANAHEIFIDKVVSLPARRHQGVMGRSLRVSLKSLDMELHQVPSLELSYGMYVGMSGGPTLLNGRPVGVNSFGFPAGDNYKTQAFAIIIDSPGAAGI